MEQHNEQIGGVFLMQPAARRLGERIRQLRLERMKEDSSYSLEGVARRLDRPTSWVRQIEMTRTTMPEPDEIQAIAHVLKVDPGELLIAAGYGELIGPPS